MMMRCLRVDIKLPTESSRRLSYSVADLTS